MNLILFSNFVLDITEGLHDLGGMRWELAGCLFVCWVFVFCCLLKGVKSMGKVIDFKYFNTSELNFIVNCY